ncbi:hypothetical protein AWJ20_1730 [Sugiyamaella lignohabitans]|uniref:NmrA-like domain-containing protein n=1 Tax=Sugiyamaella lignohabitans TaxID=796027 RepID=A0A167DYC1_9ASCO|nr:uncharacterized protein AWJ20_1730 [Sugiyamaella lignohabitans]ANB13439.1 hypothetical protein AWJ20_1730 [Sugiyamaella lignohabitans]
MSKPVVAVVGFNGNLGRPIVNALTSHLFRNNFSLPVRVITRDSSKVKEDEYPASDVKFYEAHDLDTYVKALTGVNAVLDVRAVAALADLSLIEAAKKAGVTLYSPSDYGVDYYKAGEFRTLFKRKLDSAAHAKALGLQVVQFHTGFFLEGALKAVPKLIFVDPTNKTANYPGDGSQEVTFTSLRNIGQAVAGVLSHPFNEIPEQVYIGGDIRSIKETVQTYEQVTEISLQHQSKSVEDFVKVAQDHAAKGTLLAGFQDVLLALAVSTNSANFSDRVSNKLANPGDLFEWDTVSKIAPTLLSQK